MTRTEARQLIPEQYTPGYGADQDPQPYQPIVGVVIGPKDDAEVRYFEKSSRVLVATPDLLGQRRYLVPIDETCETEDTAALVYRTGASAGQLFAVVGETFEIKDQLCQAGLIFERATPFSERFSADRFRPAWVGSMETMAPLVRALNLTIVI